MRRSGDLSPLILCASLLAAGIVMGVLSLRVLSVNEKAELLSYLEVFMRGLRSPGVEAKTVFRLSLVQNLRGAALLWAFGMAIVGAPLTCLMLLVRGFVVGFSASFVVREVTSGGTLMFLCGILPHNLLAIPAMLLIATLSLSFSLSLFRGRPWAQGAFWQKAGAYTVRCLVVALAFVLSALIEAYISPLLLVRAATS